MNKYLVMHRIARWTPMTGARRLRCTSAIYSRQYAAEKQEVEALRDPDKLESFHNDWQYQFHMHSDEEREYYSRKLLKQARHLRVLVPKMYEGSNLTADYEESSLTGSVNLSLQGENKVRAAIREEQKHRSDRWVRRVPYVTALTGLIGTITGLIAVIDKWGR